MIKENEIIVAIIGIGIFVFLVINYSKISKIPESKILISVFFIFLLGWIFTVIESLVLESLFNLIEHFCYIIGSFLLLFWVFKLKQKRDDDNEFN
ncbi:MAG: hypothetical protein KGD63_03575 [Candidatus Lokiarchaeota archaeon]|nr:hypothetical protein [Candidatus Lokiarchaeota archaeon]